MNACNFWQDQASEEGDGHLVRSVIDGSVIATVPLLDTRSLHVAMDALHGEVPTQSETLAFLDRLKCKVQKDLKNLSSLHQEESGFIHADNEEVILGLIDFLDSFPRYAEACEVVQRNDLPHVFSERCSRHMRIVHRAAQCVAIMVPQNASLGLAVLAMACALFSGARVVVRPSQQCGATGAWLAEMVALCAPPVGCIAVVNCKAADFLDVCMARPEIEMIHYIGSDRFALEILRQAHLHGKHALIDGEGNGILLVADDFDIADAASLITKAATRYNGQTCTSVNGVLVTPARQVKLLEAMAAQMKQLEPGDPREVSTQLGPLFSAQQATVMLERAKASNSARIVCGGETDKSYMQATLVADPAPDDVMVHQGFFGPVCWMAAAPVKQWSDWLQRNRFALSDTLLSHDDGLREWMIRHSRAGRLCFNEDPSIESMFEPWGGYAPAAHNPVSQWLNKYQFAVQVDADVVIQQTIHSVYRA
ncbi:MAG: aldehyde dehydrogenase family protein [Oleiphilaceae bacterium]|nr:aldehyde dehydrogenase family protein [Oleiphilaceae bacterium]